MIVVEGSKYIESYFNQVKENYLKNKGASKETSKAYKLGNSFCQVNYLDEKLYNILGKALRYLEYSNEESFDLTIYCWSRSTSTNDQLEIPFQISDYVIQGLIEGYNDDRFYSAFQHGSGAFVFYDRLNKVGLFYVNDPEVIPYWEQSFPFKNIFHWWTLDSPYQLTHSGSVCLDGKAVLLSGAGGSGKSSTTLSCVQSGLDTLGDDYVLINSEINVIYSLYGCAKINIDNINRFDDLKYLESKISKVQEKALVFFEEQYNKKPLASAQLKAHLIPKVSHQNETTFEKISSSDGMKSLAPSTIFQLPRMPKETFAKCGRIAKSLPTYRILLGTNPKEIASAIGNFISKL